MTDSYINILAPDFRRDPYPHYAALRRDHPVCRVDPGGMWAVTRHEDVGFMLKHPEIFSSAGFREAWEPSWVQYNPLARSMLAMDPPSHTRLRALVQRAFSPQAVLRLEQQVTELARDLARGLDGDLDAVEAISIPLPAFVIGKLLGLDTGLQGEFKRWADDMLSIMPAPPSEAHAARVRASIGEITGYIAEVVAARRLEPRSDTVSDLIQAEVDGQALTTTEIVDFLALLLLGGLETTTHMLSNALLLWSEQPGLFNTVRADPSCLPDFVEELLRYDTVGQMIPRLTTREVELRGVTIPAGELVMAILASANRDEQVFEDPDRFDMKRGGRGGIAFGLGHHFCIGAGLARMEMRVMLAAVAEHVQRIELCGDVEYNCTLTTRGPVRLPLRVIPA